MSKSAISVGYSLASPYTCNIQINGSGSRERFFSTIDKAMACLPKAQANARAELMSASDEVATGNLTTSAGPCNGIYYADISIPATMTAEELNGWLPKIRACAIGLFERVSELTAQAASVSAPTGAEVTQ